MNTNTKKTLYWCMYDWANSAFAVSILSGLFPIFFKTYWGGSLSATDSTFWLSILSTIVSAFIFLFSPILGQMSNHTTSKMKYLKYVTAIGAASCLAFVMIGQNEWLYAGAIFIIASICFHLSCLLYDALLPEYSEKMADYHKNSLIGYGLGYLGGGVLFLLQSIVIQKPELLGLADKQTAVYLAFFTTGLWWILFSLPLFFTKPIQNYNDGDEVINLKAFFIKLFNLFKNRSPMSLFLISFFFYMDGLATVYKMAVDYGLAIGLETGTMIQALLLVQFVGFPAAFFFTWLAKKTSTFFILKMGIMAYFVVILLATQIETAMHFLACGVLIGVFQGAVQALSRSYFCELIPSKEETGSYFGLYNMLGKFSAVFGPLTTGLITSLTGSHRIGLASLSIYLILGLVFFPKMKK